MVYRQNAMTPVKEANNIILVSILSLAISLPLAYGAYWLLVDAASFIVHGNP